MKFEIISLIQIPKFNISYLKCLITFKDQYFYFKIIQLLIYIH